MKTRLTFFLLAAILLLLPASGFAQKKKTASDAPVRVACVGNSITYGFRLPDPARDSYPSQLQLLLGDGYEVGNFGHSGATLLRRAYRPYFDMPEYKQAMEFKGDIIVIHLGINDTDPRAWPELGDEFVGDYLALIDSLRSVNPRARVLIARMTPIADRHPRFLSGTLQWHGEIQQAIEEVARISGAELIDFFEPLYPYPWLLPDAIHPDVEGAAIMAKTVCSAITGDYGGLQLPMLYTDNMVLQRNKPLAISGTANAGEAVDLKLTDNKGRLIADAAAVANNRGEWTVELPALQAAEGLTLTISTRTRTRIYNNVCVGEVWLCSGQSNMAFRLNQSADGMPTACADKGLRLFDMKERWPTDNVTWTPEAIDSVRHLQYFYPAQWQEATPERAAQFSAVAWHFGRMLRDSLKCPVGLICNAIGGSTTESWVSRDKLEHEYPDILRDWLHNDLTQQWCRQRAAKNLGLPDGSTALYYKRPVEDFRNRHPYEPAYLYEAALRPMRGYGLGGVIWYQGESNAHNKDTHARLFPMMASTMRETFCDEALPLLFVQLSSLSRRSWPAFRDSQRQLADAMQGVSMVVTTDVGDSLDVHPRLKQPVGQRLALAALQDVYGHACTGHSPRPCAVAAHVVATESVPVPVTTLETTADAAKRGRQAGSLIVTFDQPGLRTSDGQAPSTFELSSDGYLFYPATARIEGQQVVVSSSEVYAPRYVRYGWQPFTRANLIGKTGLPVSTFRLGVDK